MQSFIKSVTRKMVMTLTAVALFATTFLAFADRASALSISVGTPTVVSGVTVDQAAAALDGDRVHVVYSTVSATEYCVSYASNTLGGGYTITVISSGAIANKPRNMVLAINPTDGAPHIFYSDSSSSTINHLVGPNADTTIAFVLGAGKVTTTGLAVGVDGSGFILAYSSLSAVGGTYNLVAASSTFAAADAFTTFINVVTTAGVTGSGSVATGEIAVFTNSTNLYRGIAYFDTAISALRVVYLSAGAVIESSRETIDTGSSISDVFAIDSSNITRLGYTDSSLGVKLAVQRRKTSTQAWYIQRLDASGSGATIVASGAGSNGTINVAYVRSSVLYLAKGQGGTFFDDFTESIVNAQRGIANIGASAQSVALLQNVTTAGKTRGAFVNAAATAISAINWTSLNGNVKDSWLNNLSSIRLRSNVSNGGSGVTGDFNPATAETMGGLTNNAGNYTIDIASGATTTVSASSTSWVFVFASSPGIVQISTAATLEFTDAINAINFIAVSSPVINTVFPSSASVASGFNGNASAAPSIAGTFVLASSNSTNVLSNGFAAGMNARLVLQSAQGTTPTVAVSTDATETGALPLTGTNNTSAATFNVTSTMTWGMASSTASAFPKWYSLVVSTKTPAGHLMSAIKVDAFQLRGIEVAFASGTSAQTLPGISVETSTGQFNTSVASTFIMRSSSPYTNVWSAGLLLNNVFLTTSTTLPGAANLSYATDFPVWVNRQTADAHGGGSDVAIGTASIVGATAGTYYLRISSRPVSLNYGVQAQFALSPAITISTPAITSVRLQNSQTSDTSATIDSSGTYRLLIEGRGFIQTSTAAVSFTNEARAIDGMPVSTHTNVTSYTRNSSTSAEITVILGGVAQANSKQSFYVFITTGHGSTTGTVDLIGVQGSTVIAKSPASSVVGSTAAITRVDPSTGVANTRTYTMSFYGRGLRGGSTVQFFANDGSTATNAATVAQASNLGGLTLVTATVDFRRAEFAGKTFNVIISSTDYLDVATGLTSSSNTTVLFAANVVSVSSLSVSSLVYPSTVASTLATGVYNSTGNPVIGVIGIGLAQGTSFFFDTVLSSGQALGFEAVNSSGTYATIQSTAFFNAAAGTYTGRFIGRYLPAGQHHGEFISSSTINIPVLANAISAITPLNNSNYSPLAFGSFTITGTGLVDGTTVQLVSSDIYAAKIYGGSLSMAFSSTTIHSIAVSSATAGFDLRPATSTAWTMFVSHPSPNGGASRVLSGAVTINKGPILAAISQNAGNNRIARRAYIFGAGLTNGATVQATPSSIVTTTLGDGTIAVGTAAFLVNGALTVLDSSGTTGFIDFDANKAPGTWTLTVSSHIAAGGYRLGTLAPTDGALPSAYTYTSTGSLTYTVSESSAPNAPTGLTVLSAGVQTVTLRWSAPGDDGTTNTLDSNDKFILYYSSGEDIRGQGCAPCYPASAPNIILGTDLTQFSTNYTFANTWAQFLPFGYVDSAIISTSIITNTPQFNFSSSTTKGLVVSTKTITLAEVTVDGAVPATIAPGATVQAVVSINPGSKDGRFWFVVRAQDEAGNISDDDLLYTTASATILASAGTSNTIDPNATTILTELSLGGGVTSGGTIPPGALDGTDTMIRTADTNPPASDGATVVGPAVDITLGSGKTEFLKAITLTFTLSGAALAQVQAADPNLVKLAFFNGSRWVAVADSVFSGNSVSGRVTHLTKFGVIIINPVTNLDNAIAYPNPYRPSLAAHAANNPKITFDLLPAGSKIKIFTIAGDLVRDFADVDRNGSEGWDAKNGDGQDVASGVYIALIDGGGDKKTMKVAVQR